MRPCFLVLLGVTALLQPIDAVSLTKDSHVLLHSEVKFSIERRLRYTPEAQEEEEEERGFTVPGVSKIQNIVNKQQLARWLRKGKSTDDVFAKLKLNKAGSAIFENPKFVTWIKYVDDFNAKHTGETISAIPTLSKQYGDDILAKMLQQARQVETTKATATRLQTEQMGIWRREGISSDAVFATFKLDEGVANLLANPGFNIWARYLTEFNPGKKTTIFKTLETHFSENTLSQLLIAAQKNPSTETLATSLQNVQLKGFLERGESPNAVFKLLQLDKGSDNLFANPQFKTWRNYATSFQKTKSDGAPVPVIDTLTAHYTDISLVKMITTAKSTEGTKQMATYVEKSLIGKWAKDGKEPTYVSKLLWASATDKKNLEAVYLEQLVIHSTVKVSSKLQLEQISVWMGLKETPDAVFKLLKLNKGSENVFKRPQFDTWLKFANTFKTQNPEKSKSVFSTLSAHYDDLPLAKMIKTAKEDRHTKKIAEYVEQSLLAKWAADGKAPSYVLNKLATDKQDKERVLALFMKEIRKVEGKITRAES